jgi:branched-chain amino acid transport system permease protein
MTFLLQSAVDAISLGFLYALVALGVALIFGIMGLINFAYGELIMAGGFAFYFLYPAVGSAVAALGTIALVVALAVVMERVAFRPVRGASPATLFVTSLAVSFFLQSVANLAFGSEAKPVGLPLSLGGSVHIGSIRIGIVTLIVVAVSAMLIGGLSLFLKRTQAGLHMRAAAEDFEMARMLGVRANRIMSGVFALSGVLAAAVALAMVAQSGVVYTTMGQGPVLIGFVATVVGGLGSLMAAGVGGFVIGFLSISLQAALPESARSFRDAFLFGAVALILMLRPDGLIVLKNRVGRV